MTAPDETAGERALSELLAELTGIARRPAHCDPAVLDRLNTAFGRVSDHAPAVYGSDPSVVAFHFETDYFATPDDADQGVFYDHPSGGE